MKRRAAAEAHVKITKRPRQYATPTQIQYFDVWKSKVDIARCKARTPALGCHRVSSAVRWHCSWIQDGTAYYAQSLKAIGGQCPALRDSTVVRCAHGPLMHDGAAAPVQASSRRKGCPNAATSSR